LILGGKRGIRRTAGRTRDVLDVAFLMDGPAVFVGIEIDREIDWLGANCAGYFWERVTTHKCLLWTVTSSLEQKEMQD
jgi:hypothetical protein